MAALSAVWLAVTSPRRTAGCNRGVEIAVAPDNPQDGLSFIHGISINDWETLLAS